MIPARTPQTSRDDVDLRKTRRTFLFAREQVAAQTSGYCSDLRARNWAHYARAERAVTDTSESLRA
jgi:hypothetical protein